MAGQEDFNKSDYLTDNNLVQEVGGKRKYELRLETIKGCLIYEDFITTFVSGILCIEKRKKKRGFSRSIFNVWLSYQVWGNSHWGIQPSVNTIA